MASNLGEQMDRQIVAGVDSSTQATKVVVVDAETGSLLAGGRAAHVVSGINGARQTDPRAWVDALREALAATGLASRIRAISIAGQQHGLVALDAEGEPVHDAMLWNDTRSAVDADELVDELAGPHEWARRVGLVPVASFTITKWAWLRRTRPDLARAVTAVRLPHDFLTERLTGRGVTDRGDASGTGWWSPSSGEYVDPLLALPQVQLDEAMLPTVLAPGEAAGEVTSEASTQLGLAAGTLVATGTGDNMGAALSLGVQPGEPLLSLGTSGTAFAVATTPIEDPTGIVAGFADATGAYLPLAATLNCTLAIDHFATWLGLDREDVAPDTGVTVLPFLDGERTPNLPTSAGLVYGVRHTTTPQEILLAAYQGAAGSLLLALQRISELAGNDKLVDRTTPITVIGGGGQGRAWRQVIADLSGRPVLRPTRSELVATGAAVQAAALVTGDDPASVANRWDLEFEAPVEPRHDASAALVRIARWHDIVRQAAIQPN